MALLNRFGANRGQTAHFRQSAPEMHVSPQIPSIALNFE